MATEREVRGELEKLRSNRPDSPDLEISVDWDECAPEERPEGISWELTDDTLTLTYDLWSAQRECLDTLDSRDHDIVAFLAGYGTGKSVLGARWLLAHALSYSGSRFLAMGVDFQKARETTFRKLFEQLPGDRTALTTSSFNGPETSPIVADYNRQEHRLTLVNDSTITLGSADQYSRYAGAEFGAVWLDEPSHYGDELHDLLGMITTRLRGVDGPKTQLWTLTGEGYNAAWEILEQRQDADGDPIGLDIEVVRASVLDNPYLNSGDIDRFRRKFEGTAKETQALHGGFAAATGLVYSNFRRDTHVIPHREAVERVDTGWRVYGYDSGWNNPRVLLEIGKTSSNQLVVLDEFRERESHVEDVIDWLEEGEKPTGTIVCDHDPDELDRFNRAGYQAERASKSLDEGIAEVRRRLEADGNLEIGSPSSRKQARVYGTSAWTSGSPSPNELRRRRDYKNPPNEEPEPSPAVGLMISETCQNLVREFLGYKEDHVGKADANDHCLDALRYACMAVKT
ncbi:terminase large subunit domain-containing protein [Natronorarus salvus]|uniref:terminase large subunit domain-containing protein n=1 Tax=Natronorarus salvus TaxID=3117733 RepID=UPI002F260913